MVKLKLLMVLAMACTLSGCFGASVALPGGGSVTVGLLEKVDSSLEGASYGG